MGDMSELRGLVTVGSFISIFALLIIMTPIAFFTLETGKQIDVPDYFDVAGLQNFNVTWNSNVDNGTLASYGPYFTMYYQDLDDGSGKFGGWEFNLLSNYDVYDGMLIIRRYEKLLWVFKVWRESVSWTDQRGKGYGEYLDMDELDEVYDDYERLEFTCEIKGVTKFTALFSFNLSRHDLPSEAWEDDELYILCGMGYDQVQTSFNAWAVISQILFFQSPNVHPLLNAFVAVPLWIAIAYIAYIMILRAIGALFGGGA